jgi:hypothetical protein
MESVNPNPAPRPEEPVAEDVELFASYSVEEIDERRELFTPSVAFLWSSNGSSY